MADGNGNYLFMQQANDDASDQEGIHASLGRIAQLLMQLPQEEGLSRQAILQTILAFHAVIDHLPIGILVVDEALHVRLFNRRARELLDIPEQLFARGMPDFADLIRFNAQRGDYGPGDPEALTGQIVARARLMQAHHFERTRPNGTVLDIRGEPLPGGGFVTIWTDITEKAEAQTSLSRRNEELEALNHQLETTQQQLLQSEKLASIGQLAAGVAHEINNPIGYVHSNISTLENYIQDLFAMLDAYEDAAVSIPDEVLRSRIHSLRQTLDVEFLKEDIPQLMGESKEGITRVKKIVQDLKDFSHVDAQQEWQWADLHKGIDSTLNIVANEVKYKADVVREYGTMPEIECLPSQLNQVFMNLLVNAAHAMGDTRGTITVRTGTSADGASVWLEFADNGSGIPEEIQQKIFDPFFTTKPIGKGTGLGLSLSYGIISNHNGSITLDSEPGRGTTFRITLPVRCPAAIAAAEKADQRK